MLLTDIPENVDDPFLTSTAIPEEFETILNDLAANGQILHPWNDLKRLIRWKICKVLDQYFATCGFIGPITQSFPQRKSEIILLLNQYDRPPFTIQRIAEVLQRSWSQYRKTHTLMNSLVKLLSVALTVSEY